MVYSTKCSQWHTNRHDTASIHSASTQFHADRMGQGLVSGKAPEGFGDLRPSLLPYFRRLEPSLTYFLTHFQELE